MNSITAEVYILDVPYSADNLYSYHVPKELEHVRKGSIVEVPFGKGNRSCFLFDRKRRKRSGT